MNVRILGMDVGQEICLLKIVQVLQGWEILLQSQFILSKKEKP